MKWQTNFKSLKPRRYEIKHDPLVGFYFYVFEDGKCICDYLQNTLELAMDCAWEDFGVSKNVWERVDVEAGK